MSDLPETTPPPEPACPHCLKPLTLCVCEDVGRLENRIALLVLQHPQEQDRELGTARLATRILGNSVLKVGLSWPSLAKAFGHEADPARWAVLHLGAAHAADLPADRDLVVLDRKGAPLPDQDAALRGLRGIVVFDGSWSQAKTLWWRNPWVLKARRLALNPKRPSLYGKLRREPRREGLSTIEATAIALARIENRPEIEKTLRDAFALMLDRYRAVHPPGHRVAGEAQRPDAPKRRWGKRPRQSAGSGP